MLYKYSNGQNKTFRDGRLLKSIYFLSVKLWSSIKCISGEDTPIPFSRELERAVVPQKDKLVEIISTF